MFVSFNPCLNKVYKDQRISLQLKGFIQFIQQLGQDTNYKVIFHMRIVLPHRNEGSAEEGN